MVMSPSGMARSMRGWACSPSTWRQRPQGAQGSPRPSTQAKAISRPPPVRTSSDTSPHSAHRVTP